MKKDYFILALGNLKHRGVRSWLTILGVFIGIAAVVALITLGNGLRGAVTGQFSSLSADKLVILNAETGMGAPGSTAITKLNEQDIEVISKIRGIEEIVPRLIRIIKIEFNEEAEFTYSLNLPEDKNKIEVFWGALNNIQPESGRLLKAEDSHKIVLGFGVAKNFFDEDIEAGDNVLINGKSFEVVGTLEKSGSVQTNHLIIINEKEMKELMSISDEWDMILVQVSDSKDAEDIAKKIREELREDRNEDVGEEDFSVQTPLQSISGVNLILDIVNLIVAGIAAISLIIGGMGIANTMYTSVLERTKEIGIMKSIGAKNKEVLYIFIIESGLLGLIGGVIGAIFGIGLAFGISGIANLAFGSEILKVTLEYHLIIGSIAFAFAVGLLSGLMPAFQASKLKPVDALRKC